MNNSTFYGGQSENLCAYCYKHRLALTPKQLTRRKCLARQCGALSKLEHPLWEKKEQSKVNRRARKERLNKLYEEIKGGVSNAV